MEKRVGRILDKVSEMFHWGTHILEKRCLPRCSCTADTNIFVRSFHLNIR